MIFSEKEAARVAREWAIDKYQVARWREKNEIPDLWATHSNFAKPHRLLWYARMLSAISDGWINSEELCRAYNWSTRRISNLMSFQRNPGRLKPRTLYGEEIDAITRDFLAPLQTMVDSVLARAKATPADQMYDEGVQADLALILSVKILRPSRCRQGFTEQDMYKLRALQAGKKKKLKFADRNVLRDVFRQLEGLQSILNEEVPVETEIITKNHEDYERAI